MLDVLWRAPGGASGQYHRGEGARPLGFRSLEKVNGADLQPPRSEALAPHYPPGTAPQSLPMHAGYTPDTHRRLKLNLRCVTGGDTERLRRGAAGAEAG